MLQNARVTAFIVFGLLREKQQGARLPPSAQIMVNSFTKFTGKHLCRSLLLIKLHAQRVNKFYNKNATKARSTLF